TRYGIANPHEKTRNHHHCRLVPTYASNATANGARHGAATIPIVAPRKNTPSCPACDDIPAARCTKNCGGRISNNPNMLNASATNSADTPSSTHWLCNSEPNNPPVNAAMMPSTE